MGGWEGGRRGWEVEVEEVEGAGGGGGGGSLVEAGVGACDV